MENTIGVQKRLNVKTQRYSMGCFVVDILFLIILFQAPIQKIIPTFSYADEILALVFGIILVFNYRFVRHNERVWMLSVSFVILLTLMGSLINRYQPFSIAVSDLFIYMKFWLCLFGAICLYRKKGNLKSYLPSVSLLKFLIVVLFVLSIADQLFHFFPTNSGSKLLFLSSEQLFFGHETAYVAYTILLLGTYCLSCEKKNIKVKKILVFFCLIMIALSLKAKAFIFIALISVFYFNLFKRKYVFVKKLMPLIIIAVIAAIVFFVLQYDKYVNVYSDSARIVMIRTSFEIANNRFPFGSGFGTFGSYFSGVNYSPVYELYGIQSTYGISQSNTSFISDNFYPMLLGQGGYLALIIFLVVIAKITRKVFRQQNAIAAIFLFYLLAASVAESSFVNTYAPIFGVLLGFSLIQKEQIFKQNH